MFFEWSVKTKHPKFISILPDEKKGGIRIRTLKYKQMKKIQLNFITILSCLLPICTNPSFAQEVLNVMMVNTPNGSESWVAGSVHPITWNDVSTPLVSTATIEYSTNNGSTWNTIAGPVPNMNANVVNTYNWTLPYIATATQCKVRVRIGTHSDMSNNVFTITGSAGTSIAENFSYNSIQMYPNPASSVLTIKADYSQKTIDNLEIKIVNLQGQEVYTEKNFNFGQAIDISGISGISAGLYFINICDENKLVFTSSKVLIAK